MLKVKLAPNDGGELVWIGFGGAIGLRDKWLLDYNGGQTVVLVKAGAGFLIVFRVKVTTCKKSGGESGFLQVNILIWEKCKKIRLAAINT